MMYDPDPIWAPVNEDKSSLNIPFAFRLPHNVVQMSVMPSRLMIGFLGAGKMATALARGFTQSKLVEPGSILASDPLEMMIVLTPTSMEKLDEPDSAFGKPFREQAVRGVCSGLAGVGSVEFKGAGRLL